MDRNAQNTAEALLDEARKLRDEAGALSFAPPVKAVYNPLSYAWNGYEAYVRRYASGPKDVLFMGMNPGPWGMAQTGVPFGEVASVRDWLGIEAKIGRPEDEHPEYPVEGFACQRNEVSGQRLWGLFKSRFGTPEAFFSRHLVVNYCPLLFIAASRHKNGREGGRNLTPDKLASAERARLCSICGRHLRMAVELLGPRWFVAVGAFAEKRALEALKGLPNPPAVVRILHPSPASPLSNRDWPGTVTKQLVEAGVWS